MTTEPYGPEAVRLRQAKRRLLARIQIPPQALPGSLALTHRRCGKASCHCADGEGHPLWSLTFMVNGRKQVEWIPEDWADAVQKRVDEGREFKQSVADLFATNARLLVLERKQRRR